MLASLFVSDLALIRRLSVDFHRGFSVLTGETGAGKSLVLDAIGLLLSSSKGQKDLVRRGEEKTEVSLFFTDLSAEARAALAELVGEEEIADGVTLSRILFADGKSQAKINGRSFPFARVSEIAKLLISIHGQHESGGLLDEKKHRVYLDSALDEFGQKALSEYARLYGEYRALSAKIAEMEEAAPDAEETVALLDFKMREIAKVKPKAGEEEALEEKLASLRSFEKNFAALATAERALAGGEKGKGAVYLLEGAARKLEQFGEEEPYSSFSAELYEFARRAKEMRDEIGYALSEFSEEDPGALSDRVQKRLDEIWRLKAKYGTSVEEILEKYEEMKQKKDLTLSLKDDIKRGKETFSELKKKLCLAGRNLSAARKKRAEQLEKEIHSVLSFLDMPKMRFSVLFSPLEEPSAEGLEKITFGIAANTGEGMASLSSVASGGELSRILLALSLRLGKEKDADTLIFDEIDTGISGEAAQKVGICLKTLGEDRQIFAVTHSAQVATLADHHFLVEKREEAGRTESALSELSEEESLREDARLLGGKDISAEAISAAKTLKAEGKKEFLIQKDTFR
jgi:DNA repair protein RecN (Recombination protein N)